MWQVSILSDFIDILVTVTVTLTVSTRNGSSQNCSVLYLLNVEPYPDAEGNTMAAVWDRGLDVIPGGHLAAEQISNRSDILPGYELKLVDIDSEACGRDVVSKGVVNVFKELVNPNLTCIVGVIGLFCSPVTHIIAPITSHPNIGGYIQLAASTAPMHHISPAQMLPNLFHITGSSSVLNEAIFAMMRAFDWHNIGIVHGSLGLYSTSIADDFVQKIESDSLPYAEFNLVTRVPISDSYDTTIQNTFDIINAHEVRISYWIVDHKQTAYLLCEAFQRRFLWPGHVFVIHEPSLDEILQTNTSCSQMELQEAMERAFLIQYRLSVDNDTELFSGWNYSEFRRRYASKLQEFASTRNEDIKVNEYANSLYDQVWAFALAINNSLLSIHLQNMSLAEYRMGNAETNNIMSSILRSELKKLSFQGASGQINFNESQESPSSVDIYQIQNGTRKLVGIYNPFERNIESLKVNILGDIPGDTFKTKYMVLPLWLSGSILAAQGILWCLTTTNFFLIIWWRKEKHIKATSPVLSTLMVIGCYFLCAEPVLLIVYRMVEIKNTTLLRALCNLKAWVSIGIELVFATLFFRILRIHRIFRSKQMVMMSDYWLDKYLFIYVLVICSGKVFLLILWSSISPIHPEDNREYIDGHTPDMPHYTVTPYCTSNMSGVWLVIILLYSGPLLLMVVLSAIYTRHIKKDTYKDTKKVNVFIFLVVTVLAVTIPLWIIFHDLDLEVEANVAEWLSFYTIPMLCQMCFFIPKILPLAMKRIKSKVAVTQRVQQD